MKKVFYVLIACALFLTSCSNPATPTATSVAPTAQPTVDSTFPTPTGASASTETAVVTGTLVRKNSDPVNPYKHLRLYLGVILIGNDGKSTLARVNPNSAPTTYTDDEGHFTFTNVPPDKYILVANLPPNNLIKLKNPETGEELLFDLTAGQTLDLGVLGYDFTFDDSADSGTPQPYPEPGSQPTVEATPYPAP